MSEKPSTSEILRNLGERGVVSDAEIDVLLKRQQSRQEGEIVGGSDETTLAERLAEVKVKLDKLQETVESVSRKLDSIADVD
jgi:hypothetical protein